MIKVVNFYSVHRNGVCYFSGLQSYDEAMVIVRDLLKSVGFSDEDIAITVTNAYQQDLKLRNKEDNELRAYRFNVRYFFKDNPYGIIIKTTNSGQKLEYARVDELDNELMKPTNCFNGKSLKLNSLEESSRWSPGRFQCKEVFFELSQWRNKGWSTLGKTKVKKEGGYDPEKVIKLRDMDYVQRYGIADIIRKLKSEGKSQSDIRSICKPKFNGGSNELKRLVASI